MKFIKIPLSVCMFAFFVFSSAGVCGENSAQTTLKYAIDDVLSILNDPAYMTDTARKSNLQQTLYDRAGHVFAFDLIARGVLGAKLRLFTSEQLDEFAYYFAKLLTSIYLNKLEGNNIDNIKILYFDSTRINSKYPDIQLVDIDTRIIHEQLEIPVVYRMINQKNTQWKIYDIRIEGISMTANYREQYRTKISDTPEDIISEIKQKVEP